MGQSSSSTKSSHRIIHKSTAIITPEQNYTFVSSEISDCDGDYISDLPDECLAHIFKSLNSGDRKRCSLVCRNWFQIEGQSRNRLALNARSDVTSSIASLFTRFDSITKLTLKCDRKSVSIADESLTLISLRCRNLTRLKLIACREITDSGMTSFAKNCKGLKKLSVVSCTFGSKGMNAVLDQCSFLEELSVKRLRGITDGFPAEPIGLGVCSSSLKSICLKELYNGQLFGPLIVGAKNLKSLKVFRCNGNWDELFESIPSRVSKLVEVHLERIQVSDDGIDAISKCFELEILHLVKTPECTNASILAIAEGCKLLRKLHIDGRKQNRIGDEGLIAIAKHCINLQELVLIGVNPTKLSLGLLGNCPKLERLALCGSETIGDLEVSCVAEKCMALKKLCIKGCPVSNCAMEALVGGCPKLEKVKLKKCGGVTSDGVVWLRWFRPLLTVNVDITATENLDASSTSDSGPPEIGAIDVPSSSNARSSLSKARLGVFVGRNFAACTFRRWSNNSNSDGT